EDLRPSAHPPLTAGGQAAATSLTPFTRFLAVRLEPGFFQGLKPNREKPRERGWPQNENALVYPASTPGLLPLRGKPRERGWRPGRSPPRENAPRRPGPDGI